VIYGMTLLGKDVFIWNLAVEKKLQRNRLLAFAARNDD
jgi:hypothetical protein